MLETVIRYGIIFYVLGIMMAIGIIAKSISYFTTRKLVKEAGDIQKSNQRLMRLVKAKFEHASMVSDKVKNVEAFVQKYMYEYEVWGVRLSTWRTLSIKMAWLIFAIGILGSIGSYLVQGMVEHTLWYGAFAGIYAVILISMHILSNEKENMEAVKNYMVEYLENVCIHRYEKANRIIEENQQKEETVIQEANVQTIAEEETEVEYVEETMEEMSAKIKQEIENNPEMGEKEEIETQEVKKELEKYEEKEAEREQEMRIRAILEEFLA